MFADVVHAEEMYCPALHDAQPEQAVLPVVVVNWPPGQAEQAVLPAVFVNRPPGHDVQTVFAEMLHAAEMYFPVPQNAQLEQAVFPAVIVN